MKAITAPIYGTSAVAKTDPRRRFFPRFSLIEKVLFIVLVMTAPGPRPSLTTAPADKSMKRIIAGERQSWSIPLPNGAHLQEIQRPERTRLQNKLHPLSLEGSATD